MIAPTIGISVKLKTGMLRVSARTVHVVTDVHKLVANEQSPDGFVLTARDVQNEGGYWIKTDHTKGEWWAWWHFRIA